jgi:hypothetical protein
MGSKHRMAHIRLLATDLAFAPLINEHHLILSSDQRPLLEDVRLTLFGYLTHAQANTRIAPNDVHLYIDGQDITPSYIAVLKAILEEEDQDYLRKHYEQAMNAWIEMLEHLGGGYGEDTERDRISRDNLLAVRPFSALIDQLGNVQTGRFGALHVTNFLWSQIDLPMVSLAAAIDHHNNRESVEAINMTAASRLTVSNGPCRLFVEDWAFPKVFGSVRLQAEMQYHNSLADEIDQLAAVLDELDTTVNASLTAILDAVDRGGEIASSIRRAQRTTEKGLNTLSDISEELKSHKRQIDGLQATAADLKTAIDSL